MNAEEIFLQHIKTIDKICAFVCRRNHVTNPDQIDEFTQEVKFRLIDDDYAIIRKFEGRSTFSTYLTTVIQRLFYQRRIEEWGKWRPSAEATRLGDKAVAFEKLMTRDGLTFDEAVQTLTTPASSTYTVAELEAYYLRLPVRTPRPMLVSDEETPEATSDSDSAERVDAEERERTARRTCEIVDGVEKSLAPQDQLIVRLRFWEACTAPEIAEDLHIEQKKVYKRLDKLLDMLRVALEKEGIDRRDIDMLVSSGDQEIRFDFSREKPESRSLSPKRRGGRGRR